MLYTQCPRRSGARGPARQRVPVVLILRLRHAHEPGQQTDGRLSGLSDKSALICAGRARQTPPTTRIRARRHHGRPCSCSWRGAARWRGAGVQVLVLVRTLTGSLRSPRAYDTEIRFLLCRLRRPYVGVHRAAGSGLLKYELLNRSLFRDERHAHCDGAELCRGGRGCRLRRRARDKPPPR